MSITYSKHLDPLESRCLLATVPAGFIDTQITAGLKQPTAIALAPDGRIFVAEQAGNLRIIKNGRMLANPFVTLKTTSEASRGLIGVAIDPEFETNHFVYVYYTRTSGRTSRNVVARLLADGDVAAAGSEATLLSIGPLTSPQHNGGGMTFGSDGKLYVGVGDDFNAANAQSLTSLNGKVLRINPNGKIPRDNPFYTTASGGYRSIWATGVRNPFTLAAQPGTGRVFVNDVGLDSFEEVNNSQAGANFGWPLAEGPTSTPGQTAPFYTYDHSVGACVIGGAFYNPAVQSFPSEFVGDYFFGDYVKGWIDVMDLTDGQPTVQHFATGANTLIDIDLAADGSLYYLARGNKPANAAVYRIVYAPTSAPVITVQPEDVVAAAGSRVTFSVGADGAAPLAYQWRRNGKSIRGANTSSLVLSAVARSDNGATFTCVITNSKGPTTTNSAKLTVPAGGPPVASIKTPKKGTTYAAGQTFTFSGSGTDPEDGLLPTSAMTWEIQFRHDSHFHPFYGPVTGKTRGSFTIPVVDETAPDVDYRIQLIVKDKTGLIGSTTRILRPQTSTFAVATSIAGLSVTLDDRPIPSPASVVGVVGMKRMLGAPITQTVGGITYEFDSWSDGGAATHDIFTPASHATYTATYRPVVGVPPKPSMHS